MKKLIPILLFIPLVFSCLFDSKEIEIKPQVIAYYAGDEKSIDEFDLNGVDQIIYSFLHLKGNKLAIDDIKDSLALVNIVNQKKNYPKLKVLVSLGGWGGCETCSDVFSSEKARIEFAISTADIIESFNADGIDLDWEYPGISSIYSKINIHFSNFHFIIIFSYCLLHIFLRIPTLRHVIHIN